MMKHQYYSFLLAILMSMVSSVAMAYDAEIDGIYYNFSGTRAIVVPGDNPYSGDVTIPSSVSYNDKTYEVTEIGAIAFYYSNISSISIPESVTSIGKDAFFNCYELATINFSDNVASIGENAFVNSAWFRNQPEGLVYAGKVAYEYKGTMPENTSIDLREGTLGIAEGAFSNCSGLISINLPESVTNIGSYAFYKCQNLTSVVIPENADIGIGAFEYCSSVWHSMEYIKLPVHVASIGDCAFLYTYIRNVINYAKSPFKITINTFGSYLSTLYVPKGCRDAYLAADFWNYFEEIIEFDYVDVPNQTIASGGSTTLEIEVNNIDTDIVAFQMDLTLPEGVSLDKTGCSLSSRITDEEQELTIGKLENGAYRLTSSSLSLTPISGNDGTLLTLKLTAAEGSVGGQATISNIRFSTSNSNRVTMDDETFDINVMYKVIYTVDGEAYKTDSVLYNTQTTLEAEPSKEGYTFSGWSELPEMMPNHDVVVTGAFYLYGDVNTDEEVDVLDVVDIARYVVAMPSVNFRERLADLNLDNTVNLGDAVVLVNHIAGDQNFVKAWNAPSQTIANDVLRMSECNGTLSLNLENERDYTAFQFDLYVPENSNISQMVLNAGRRQGHQLLYNKVKEGHYRVAALSTSNLIFNGNAGELLNITMNGTSDDELSVRNIRFFDAEGHCYLIEDVESTIATSLTPALSEREGDIYNVAGQRLNKMQRGVNITGGKKILK